MMFSSIHDQAVVLPEFHSYIADLSRAWETSSLQRLVGVEAWNKELREEAKKLGSLGWTIPLWSLVTFVSDLLREVEEKRIDKLFVALYTGNRGKQFSELFAGIIER